MSAIKILINLKAQKDPAFLDGFAAQQLATIFTG